MAPETTTVRIRVKDKAKLEELCADHKRGQVHELSYLIGRAHTSNGKRRKIRRAARRGFCTPGRKS